MKKRFIHWGLVLALLLSLVPAGTAAAKSGAQALFAWTASAAVAEYKAAITDNLITYDATATTKSNTHYVKELDVTTAQGKGFANAYFIGASWFKHTDGTLYGLPAIPAKGYTGQNEYVATEGLDLHFTNGVNANTTGKEAVNVSFVFAATTHTGGRVDTNVVALDTMKLQVSKNGNEWLDGSVGIRSWELIGRETVSDKLTTYLIRIETEDLMTIDGLKSGDTIRNIRLLPHGDHYYAWSASYFGISELTINGYATAAEFNAAVPNERNDMVDIGEQKMRDIVIARAQAIAHKEWKTDKDIVAYNQNCFYGAGILYRGPMYARSVKSGYEVWREWIDDDGNYIGAKEGADVSGMDCHSFAYDTYSVVSRSHSWILWQTLFDNSLQMMGNLKTSSTNPTFTELDVSPYNDPQDVYKAYAEMQKGDIFISSGTHIILATGRPVVVYKEDGTIDPDKSYTPTIEEQSTARFHFKGETGDPVIVWPTYITGTDSKQPTLAQVEAYAKENGYKFLYASSPREDDITFTKMIEGGYVPMTLEEYQTGKVEAVDLQILMMPKDGGNVTSGFTVAAAMDHYADRMRVTLEKKDGTVLYEDELLSNGSAFGRPRQYNYLWSYDSSEEMNKVLKGLTAGDYRIGVYMLAGYVTEVGADKSEVVEYHDFSYNGIPAKETPDHDCPALAMNDVANDAWYHTAVDYALTNGLMSGYNATTFGPNDTLSRAMVVQVLYNKEGKPAITAGHSFPDVASGDWFNNAVAWGSEKGVVSGFGDGKFRPNDAVTLEQVAVILHNFSGKPAASGQPTGVGNYDDWAEQALSWAVAQGIMEGVPFTNATENATRAQTAQMLMNFVTGTQASQPSSPSGINSHTHTAGWKSLNNAIAGMQAYGGVYVMGTSVPGGTYYLTEDLDLGSNYIQLNAGIGDITVCLNGHTLSSTSKMVFRFNNNCDANLTICDCSADQTGKVALANRVKGTDYQVTSGTVLARSSGTFNLYGGTLVGGVSCVSTTVNIYGGKIQALADGEVLYIHGTETGKINIEGGEFEGYNGAAPRLTHRGTGSVCLYGGTANTTKGLYSLTKAADADQYTLTPQ